MTDSKGIPRGGRVVGTFRMGFSQRVKNVVESSKCTELPHLRVGYSHALQVDILDGVHDLDAESGRAWQGWQILCSKMVCRILHRTVCSVMATLCRRDQRCCSTGGVGVERAPTAERDQTSKSLPNNDHDTAWFCIQTSIPGQIRGVRLFNVAAQVWQSDDVAKLDVAEGDA